MDLFFVIALFVFIVTCFTVIDLFTGVGSMRKLSSFKPLHHKKLPFVSVIVPACNEEEKIAKAIHTQLQQDYPHYEIIVINDRSTDSTGTILQNLEMEYGKLRVINIVDLPEGWMGKAHAMHRGAENAAGDYLLFTDADILMDKNTVLRAVDYMLREDLDHISLVFKNISSGWLLNSLILESGAALFQIFKPWLVRKKSSSRFIGVGAFNLVRKSVYEAIGGHKNIRMHPIDDIMLGKTLKKNGYRQECLIGTDLISVSWYKNVPEMVDGLMKNILAIINYRFILLIPLLLAIFTLNILPLWGVVFTTGYTRLFFAGAVTVRLFSYYIGARFTGVSPWCALGTILTPYLSAYIFMRAAYLNYRDDGIIWRGTYYSLKQLKKNKCLLP